MDFTKINFALFNVYEFPNGLYTSKEICNKLNIGNPYDRKKINDNEYYAITKNEIIAVSDSTFYKAKIIPILDMNISAHFTVFVDENDKNKLYVEKNICHRYGIVKEEEKQINTKVYYPVSLEDIDIIEKLSKLKKLTLIRKYEPIKLEKEKFKFNYFRTKDALYVTRNIYEFAKKHNVEIEAKPKIIGNQNCYSIKEEEIVNLEQQTNSIGTKIIINEPNSLKKILVYKDVYNNKLYIPVEYTPTQSNETIEIMNKKCFEISELNLNKLFDNNYLIINIYLNEKKEKQKELLNIILCQYGDMLFIPEEIIKKLNFNTALTKRIKVNENIFHQITEEELNTIKKESSKKYLINITKKYIIRN